MIKSILVPATGQEVDLTAHATAFAVARSFAAHLDALHVRLDPVEVAVSMSTEGAGGALLEGIIDSLERDATAGETSARARFSEACARAGVPVSAAAGRYALPSASFHVETGQEPRWMVFHALTSDLTVAARGVPGADAAARSTLEALLLETGRPLLIPGAGSPPPDFADRVAIAWKPIAQAARAVAFAMPFLARAKEVAVLSVEEDDSGRDAAERLLRYLAWHGIKASAKRLLPGGDGAAATMLEAAEASAGMLVMGGYGHNRLREWVFGGFTERVLDHAAIPVLMAH